MKVGKVIFYSTILLTTYLLLGILFAVYLNGMDDEGWHFNSTMMVARGLMPYRDFFWNQPPLFPYVYALPQLVFGPSLLVARFTSVVLGGVALALLSLLTYWLTRSAEPKFAFLPPLLYISNVLAVNFFSWCELYSLITIFVAIALICTYNRSRGWGYRAAAIFFMVCGVGTKISLAPAVCVLMALFVYESKNRLMTLLYVSLWTAFCLMMIFGLFLYFAPNETIYDVLTWNIRREFTYITLGFAAQKPSLAYMAWNKMKDVMEIIRSFYIIITLTVFCCYIFYRRIREFGLNCLSEKGFLITLLTSAAVVEVVHLRMFGTFNEYRMLELPFVVVFIATILSEFYTTCSADCKRYFVVLGSIAIFINPLTTAQFFLSTPTPLAYPAQAIKDGQTSLKQLSTVADYIRNRTKEGDLLFTLTPHYAAMSGRRVVSGLEYETNSIFPNWKTEDCMRDHCLNYDMLLETLTNKVPAMLVLDDRFYQEDNAGMILNDIRPKLIEAIDANYTLEKEFKFHKQLWRNHVWIYVRK